MGGVRAYSTLGRFDDPLLSTFIAQPDYQLAGLIFHELAHQQLYIRDDSTFNESFATAVEREGLRLWLAGDMASAAISALDGAPCRGDCIASAARAPGSAELYASRNARADMRAEKAPSSSRCESDYRILRAMLARPTLFRRLAARRTEQRAARGAGHL